MPGERLPKPEPLRIDPPVTADSQRDNGTAGLRAHVSGDGRGAVRPGVARVAGIVPQARQPHADPRPVPGGRQRSPGARRADGGIVRPLSRRVSHDRFSFAAPVPAGGYHWWYVDGLSDDGAFGITIIAFVGSVFSPYYALSGRGEPENHAALNVAIYRPRGRDNWRGNRWAMTERPRSAIARSADHYQVGPSSMGWDGTTLTVDFDEWSFPIPGRIKGRVRLTPAALTNRAFALDSQSRHIWWPLAPCARIEVALEEPSLSWSGTGYLDENRGSEPLEAAFENWNWSRATVGDDAVILYDILRRHGDTGQQASLALHIEPDGEVHAFDAPATQDLGPTAIWRVGRQTQSDDATRVLTTFEDTPFYSRSHIATQLLGKPTMAMHESLALNRLRSPIVKSLLPWRMPRAFWTRGPGHN